MRGVVEEEGAGRGGELVASAPLPLTPQPLGGDPLGAGWGGTRGLQPEPLPPIQPFPLGLRLLGLGGRKGGGGCVFWKERDYDNRSFFALSFILHLFLISFFRVF